jgi:hypothetical protein
MSRTTTIKAVQRVPLRLIYPSTLRHSSPVTGESYVWQNIGDVVAVLPEDAPILLAKRLGNRSCCGGVSQDGNKLFELVI